MLIIKRLLFKRKIYLNYKSYSVLGYVNIDLFNSYYEMLIKRFGMVKGKRTFNSLKDLDNDLELLYMFEKRPLKKNYK